jgi:hypothetical protein
VSTNRLARCFRRPAANARDVHRPWLSKLVEDHEAGTFVHEDSDGDVDGFVANNCARAAGLRPLRLLITHRRFCGVVSGQVGGGRLDPVERSDSLGARERGAVQVVVVSGPHDGPKRAVLQDAGLYVASEWFTAPLDES